MKALIVADVHFAQYSSIVRKRGQYYSCRLENLIWSINWAEKLAAEQHVDKIIYLGDFFDRADLNAEEATAFREICWSRDICHVFLVGNHEVAARSLEYSSVHLIDALGPNFNIVDRPMEDVGFGYRFIYLPYIFENDRRPLQEYISEAISQHGFVETQELKQLYIFSHNDIKGVQYGLFESESGFDKDEIIETGCRYFVNGHIHNHGWIKDDKILNLGNLTGQNFNEDALRYPHVVSILDTQTSQLEFFENPYALQFLKLEVQNKEDIAAIKIVPHMVLSIKCKEECVDDLREFLDNHADVEEYRIITLLPDAQDVVEEESVQMFNSMDHLQQFQSYILSQLGKSSTVLEELQEVVK